MWYAIFWFVVGLVAGAATGKAIVRYIHRRRGGW